MHRLLLRSLVAGAAGLGVLVLASCGERKGGAPAPSASAPSTLPSGAAPPSVPESPLSVVVDAQDPLVLSALEGGLVVAARTHWAHVAGGGELVAGPMPEGLPEGPGRILGAAGRLAGPVWLLYETHRDDGKVDKNPFFRLGKEGFKKFADDWKPAVVPWTKHRILAASTSSGKLKIKVIEPSLATPPDDLPSSHFGDASCEKTLHLEGLAALPTGEVFAAGTCKPDTGAGAGASASRYVVIRWAAPVAGAPAARDGGASDGGDADGGAPDRPGAVDVIPGESGALQHQVLLARSPTDVWAAAAKVQVVPPGPVNLDENFGGARVQSRLFHFDGTTWGVVAMPRPGEIRGLAETNDGTLWLLTARALFRRSAEGAWEAVRFPAEGTWEGMDLATPDGQRVWVSARRTTPTTLRHVILRSGPTPAPLPWE